MLGVWIWAIIIMFIAFCACPEGMTVLVAVSLIIIIWKIAKKLL